MLSTRQPTTDARAAAALGFTDQCREITVASLPLEGEIPAWLTGALLRNGPARWDLAKGSVNHWFDGMAMLHRFAFSGGHVSYANKLLRGRAATAVDETGKLAYREFATDPCRTAFSRFTSVFSSEITDNGSVNMIRVADRWLAITEAPMAVEFDPRTLASLGVVPLAKGARVPVAHPQLDAVRGELIGLRVAFGRRSAYEVTATDTHTGAERLIGRIPVAAPAYQHSFGLTGRFAVIGEHPLVVNPLRLALSGKPFIENYRWQPERGTRFWAVDRQTGAVSGPWAAPANFCFHHVNAYDDADGSVVVDLAAYADATVVEALSLANRRAGSPVPQPTLQRYRLRLGEEAAEREPMPLVTIELPRIDDRFAGQPYGVAFGAGSIDDATSTFFDAIVRVDIPAQAVTRWQDSSGGIPGEPVFVPRPGSTDEGDGVVLTVVLEPARGASSLVVLDARTLEEVGRALVPQHIPLGFHGGYGASL